MEITPSEQKKELVFSSFILHENGLEAVDEPTFEQWLECGAFLRKANKSLYFWLGDWLNYGNKRWGEKYLDAVDRTGYDIQTLRNYKWIASRIPTDLRKDGLTQHHYETVARSDIEYDDQKRLLQEAIDKKMGFQDFKKYVGQQSLPAPQPPSYQTTNKPAQLSRSGINSETPAIPNTEDLRQQILDTEALLLNQIKQFQGSAEDIKWLQAELADFLEKLAYIINEDNQGSDS